MKALAFALWARRKTGREFKVSQGRALAERTTEKGNLCGKVGHLSGELRAMPERVLMRMLLRAVPRRSS